MGKVMEARDALIHAGQDLRRPMNFTTQVRPGVQSIEGRETGALPCGAADLTQPAGDHT